MSKLYFKGRIAVQLEGCYGSVTALDYIVVHEMCHMFEKNHSQKFWDMLASILPDYKERKGWLKNNEIKMDL